MRKLKYFLAAVLIFILPITLWAGANGPGVINTTLANGLRVVIIPNTLAPIVTTQISYIAGSNESPEGFPGMAHALEHMMFRGSPGLSSAQLANIMAFMGGDFNAVTKQNVTQYFFTVPKGDLDLALNIESLRMRGADNSQELWELERGAMDQEIAQDLSSPEYILFARLLEKLFPGTPYASDALGSSESFQKTSGAMIKKFFDQWYAPNNAVIVIAGDVDPPEILEKVKKLFGPIPPKTLPARPAIKLQPLKPASISFETDLPYGLAVAAYRLPGSESPDYAAGQIVADVLDGRRGNLYRLVTQGKALFTGFEGGALPKSSYGYAIAAFPYGGDGPALVAAVKGAIADYVKKGVPAELVEAAKRREISDAEFQNNSIPGLADFWSEALAEENRASPSEYIEAVRKVTVDDVNRVIREYLINETAVTAVLTPNPSGRMSPMKVFSGKESFAPKATRPVELPAWAKRAAQPPGLPDSRLNPVVYTLANGVRLIVQPQTVSKGVSVFGQVKNSPNLEEPEGKEGVSEIMGALFSYGTRSLDMEAFQKAQDDITADIAAGINFSLKVLADNFERGVALLAENLLDPAFPEEGFKIIQEEMAGSLRGKLQSPSFYSQQALREALLPKDDPTLRQATPDSVNAVTLEDVKLYYKKAFRPEDTAIVVIGNVRPQTVKDVFEKYLGAWKPAGPGPGRRLAPLPLNKTSAVMVPDKDKVQDQVILAEIVGVERSHPDYYKLQLGNNVLSGAFYATRLYRDLREKTGLVYTVESFLEGSKHRSFFGVFFACDPKNTARVRAIVEQNILEMQKNPVSPEELRQAKTILIKQSLISESSADLIAQSLLSSAQEDLPVDESVRAVRQYLESTPEQVREAFSKWIRPEDLVQVVVGPDK